jgi:very-short-patch-repair endonuclease
MERISGRRPLRDRARELRKAMTPAERALWEAIRGRRCGGLRFLRQYAIGSYIVDFYCHMNRLIIEVDGSIHEEEDIWAYDVMRQQVLEDLGFAVIRFRNEDVLNASPTTLQQRILQARPPTQPL